MGRSHSRYRSKSSSGSESSTSSSDSRSHRHSKKHRTRRKDTTKKSRISTSSHSLHSKEKLKSITDKIMIMVNEDRRRSQGRGSKHTETNSSCGCPYNCGPELKKMRDYIQSVSAELPSLKENKPIVQLSQLLPDLHQLLSQTWKSVGSSKLNDLVPPDLVEICCRRERRYAKHPEDKRDTNFGKPPFDFLFSNKPFSGIVELWRRCMFELQDCSTEEIQQVMSGQLTFDRQKFMEHSADDHDHDALSCDPKTIVNSVPDDEKNRLQPADSTMMDEDKYDQPNPGSSVSVPSSSHLPINPFCTDNPNQTIPSSTVSSSVPDSEKANNLVDRVQKEIVELELRARAIRSMLKSNENQYLQT